MLQFRQDEVSIDLIVTLTEAATLPEPNYLFVFTHVLTKDVVAFVRLNDEDLSDHPERYNKFNIDPSVAFAGYQPGEWHYAIYEQESAVNVNPLLASGLLEQGKMILERVVDFVYDIYQSSTSFKTYNG